MPPVTPSPHRFLTGQRRQQSPPKPAPEPQRKAAAGQRDEPSQSTTFISSAKQFARAPRFSSFGRPAQTTPSKPQAPPRPNLAQALRASTRQNEDVEEAPDMVRDDDRMLGNEQLEVVPTTESTQQDWRSDLPYSPKRRRLDGSRVEVEPPARPAFHHPSTPASVLTANPPRFTRASIVAGSVNEDGSSIRRPAFLRSSLAPPEHYEPLPEAFSPHRRGEKFVAGGMAATLQQWVVEAGQDAMHSRKGRGYLRGEDYVLRVAVDTINGHGPLLVQGRRQDGAETRVLLVVDGKTGITDEVLEGSVVGLRAPTWEVEVDGVMWTVGVDWKVLQQLT